MATKTVGMTDDKKFELADKLAQAVKGVECNKIGGYDKTYRNYVFGVIINIKNAKGKTLVDVFGEDEATHITNLVIRRLCGSVTVESVDF